jgi:hypothetical protein
MKYSDEDEDEDSTHVVHVFCVSINRKETKQTLQKLGAILSEDGSSETKSIVVKKMVRVSIWNSNIDAVNKKLKLLDIIRIKKFTGLHTYNGTPQLNCSLQNIDVDPKART